MLQRFHPGSRRTRRAFRTMVRNIDGPADKAKAVKAKATSANRAAHDALADQDELPIRTNRTERTVLRAVSAVMFPSGSMRITLC